MKRLRVFISIVSLFLTHTVFANQLLSTFERCPMRSTVDADWLIVGAGPAGIATLGVLLDIGIPASRITWIDPEFEVGRLGAFYANVPANAATRMFVAFINSCNVFKECGALSIAILNSLDPDSYPELQLIVNPLRDITDYLRTKVSSVKACMKALYFADNAWVIETDTGAQITAHNVVLATGSHPAELNYGKEKVISLDVALNPANLERLLTTEDIVGVVGGLHSAILILKFLSELSFKVKHIYNLYRTPLTYASISGHGLRGATADWAQNVLEKNLVDNITRIQITPEIAESISALCTKMIYAIGYEKNELPNINGTTPITTTDPGLIAPRLFGIGIAFPEKLTYANGDEGYCVGLDCFMEYAQKMIPEWTGMDECHVDPITRNRCMAQRSHLQKSSSLFKIMVL